MYTMSVSLCITQSVLINKNLLLPFTNMEDSRTTYDHGMQLMFQAVLRYMLQRPVPIIIIIFTKIFSTANNFLPGRSVERHSHIVFTANPWGHLDLEIKTFC